MKRKATKTPKRESIVEILTKATCGTDMQYLFYDWFCTNSSLAGRALRLIKSLKEVAFSPRFDINKCSVSFKNNCPLRGNLYDDFRIFDIKTGNTLYCITPRGGYASHPGEAEVWGKDNKFKEALVLGDWQNVLTFFSTKPTVSQKTA